MYNRYMGGREKVKRNEVQSVSWCLSMDVVIPSDHFLLIHTKSDLSSISLRWFFRIFQRNNYATHQILWSLILYKQLMFPVLMVHIKIWSNDYVTCHDNDFYSLHLLLNNFLGHQSYPSFFCIKEPIWVSGWSF